MHVWFDQGGFLAARKASIAGLAIDQMSQSQSGWEPGFACSDQNMSNTK